MTAYVFVVFVRYRPIRGSSCNNAAQQCRTGSTGHATAVAMKYSADAKCI